jgi:formylglycine-generating enzyme required for sulfatase activity
VSLCDSDPWLCNPGLWRWFDAITEPFETHAERLPKKLNAFFSPITVFVCYAHENPSWVDPQSDRNLIPWLREALQRYEVDFFADLDISGSEEWRKRIIQTLHVAKIAILMVDYPFLVSIFIQKTELPRIDRRAKRGKMVVMPILTSPSRWQTNPLIASRQVLPRFEGEVVPLIDCIEDAARWKSARGQILRALATQIVEIRCKRVRRNPFLTVAVFLAVTLIMLGALYASGMLSRTTGAGGSRIAPAPLLDADEPAHAIPSARPWTNSLGMEFVTINPTGTKGFEMGSPESDPDPAAEEARHTVVLTKGFRICIHDVTVGQFRQFVIDDKYTPEGNGDKSNWRNPGFPQTDKNPVVYVTWKDVHEFCKWLNSKETGRNYRLPWEAEWEYACRAGVPPSVYFWGDDAKLAGEYAWYEKNSRGHTWPVGTKLPNKWGLYDMSGNVFQRCEDGYEAFSADPVQDPMGNPSAAQHVSRGGAWNNDDSYLRCAHRGWDPPEQRNDHLGFRVCLDL